MSGFPNSCIQAKTKLRGQTRILNILSLTIYWPCVVPWRRERRTWSSGSCPVGSPHRPLSVCHLVETALLPQCRAASSVLNLGHTFHSIVSREIWFYQNEYPWRFQHYMHVVRKFTLLCIICIELKYCCIRRLRQSVCLSLKLLCICVGSWE